MAKLANQNRPNILLITSDQQHYDTLGFANPHIKTPALDRLAREGTNFTRAYCPNPTCTPTRASIITGMYPSCHGAWSLGTKLMEDVPTVGDVMQDSGVQTSLIGKAHFQQLSNPAGYESLESQPTLRDLNFWDNFRGPWYGFRHLETARNHADEYHAGGHYGLWMERKGLKNWRDHFQQFPPDRNAKRRYGKWDLPEEYHYSVWTADKTIEYARYYASINAPFFCWASFHDPHPPYLVPEPWDTMYDPADMPIGKHVDGEFDDKPPHFAMTQDKDADWSVYQETSHANHGFSCHLQDEEKTRRDMAIYYGMTSLMDREIGRILDSLDEMGIADNTIVVFTTDHGHFIGQHGLTAKAAHLYEDLIRLPFLVRWPGQVPAGATSDAIQSLVDLPQTFLEAQDIEAPGVMQGVSQLDVWKGEKAEARDHAICEHRHQPTAFHVRSFITKRYKMTVYRDQTYGELYDFEKDPDEIKNFWDDPAYKDVKADLMQQFINAEMHREPMRMPRVAHA